LRLRKILDFDGEKGFLEKKGNVRSFLLNNVHILFKDGKNVPKVWDPRFSGSNPRKKSRPTLQNSYIK